MTAELDILGHQPEPLIPRPEPRRFFEVITGEGMAVAESNAPFAAAQLAVSEAFDDSDHSSAMTTDGAVREEITIVEAPGRHDQYVHLKFTEAGSPDMAREAWRIHAEGYHAMGFVKDDAITPEGFLAEGIDKSQGPNTDYYLALSPSNEQDAATMRLINVPEGETYEVLPAYQMSKDGLSEFGAALLENMHGKGADIKEIAAMARTEQANPMAVHEIIRQVVQEAQGKDVVWFFSIVTTTFDSLTKSLGEKNFIAIGDDVSIPDDRVNPAIKLRPALVRANGFYETLVASYAEADNSHDKQRFARSILFFTDGLSDEQVSPEVAEARNAILALKRAN